MRRACQGLNPRPRTNPKLHTSYIYSDQVDCFFFTSRVTHGTTCTASIVTSRAVVPKSSFFSLLFFHPIYYLRPSFSLPPSRNSYPGSHSRLFLPPPFPRRFAPCGFIARRLQPFFPRRLAANCDINTGLLSQQRLHDVLGIILRGTAVLPCIQ